MIHLKDKIIQSLALRRLDYKSNREVVLTVDTSVITVGFILSQEGEDGKHYLNCFGSISLTRAESRYSQAKLELYGLFHSLRAVRVFIFGVTNLVVEMDAKYAKGMINNPDLQPNTTINRWITSILLFHFELHHISADRHISPDGLSRQSILQIWMILRIGWTILTPFALPYSMIGYCLLLPHHAPHIWGFISLAYRPPSPRHWVTSSFYPFLHRSLCSHILLSFTPPLPSLSPSRTLPLYSGSNNCPNVCIHFTKVDIFYPNI